MTISGLGNSLATDGYDFTKMTNQQLFDTAHQLADSGKISTDDEAQLVGMASGVDSTPVNRNAAGPSVSDILASSQQNDWLATLNKDMASNEASKMYKAAAMDQSLIQDMEANSSSASTLSTQS